MTEITRKTVRETEVEYRREKLVVELLPRMMMIWPKGRKHDGVSVAYDSIYELGLKVLARRK
jgi:hypothetical protein